MANIQLNKAEPINHASTHAPGGSDPLTGYAPGGVIDCLNSERLMGFVDCVITFSGFEGDAEIGNGAYTKVGNIVTGPAKLDHTTPGSGEWNVFSPENDVWAWTNEDTPQLPTPYWNSGYATSLSVTISEQKFFQPGQLVRVIDQGGRIEQFLGGDPSNNDNWLVLKNTVELTVTQTDAESPPVYVNGVEVQPIWGPVYCGWVDPLAVKSILAGSLGFNFSGGAIWLQHNDSSGSGGTVISNPSYSVFGGYDPNGCAIPGVSYPRGKCQISAPITNNWF